VWKLDTSFRVLKSQVLDLLLQNISYFYTLKAMKLINANGTLYTIIFNTDLYHDATSYIYQVDLDSGYTLKLAVQDKLIDAAYDGSNWYLLNDNNQVLKYTSTFQANGTYTDSQYNLRMKSIYTDGNYVYLAGRGYDGGSWGAAIEVLTPSFSIYYYHQFNDAYQFYSVYAIDKYAIVAEKTLYAIDYGNNTITYEYSNSLTQVYDFKTEDFIDLTNKGSHAITIVAWNNSGNMSFAWGGFYSDSEFLYAYMVLTDKPSMIPAPPGESGGGLLDDDTNLFEEAWEEYKYYILLGGGLLLILLLVPSSGNKEVR